MKKAGKPSWDDAPEWANYLAQGWNGVWNWMSDHPYPDLDVDNWLGGGRYQKARVDIDNWEKTLERRPRVSESQARARLMELKNEIKSLEKTYDLDDYDKDQLD